MAFLKLNRFMQRGDDIFDPVTPKIRVPIIRENGFLHFAIYKLVSFKEACFNGLGKPYANYIYRLDGRSVRYAGLDIIENRT